jgi:hypothetical protein
MIDAARRAEFDFYKKGRRYDERFIPTPDSVIRVMVEAALALVTAETGTTPAAPISRIVTANPPSRRR